MLKKCTLRYICQENAQIRENKKLTIKTISIAEHTFFTLQVFVSEHGENDVIASKSQLYKCD